MKDVMLQYPQMCTAALGAAVPALRPPENVLVCGMGGSGISGDIIRDALSKELRVPFTVTKSNNLPGFVGPGTLQICISYFGNTWETLEALRNGRARGAQTVGITSGGRLAALAKEWKFPLLTVPGGMQPRAALPSLLCSALKVLEAAGLADGWAGLPIFLEKKLKLAEQKGKELADTLFGKNIIVYSPFESVARRFKTQVNENAKLPCRMDVLPELNHNETVGWQGATGGNSVVFFRSPDEPEMLKQSVEFLKGVVREKAVVAEVWPEGKTALEQILFSVMVGDFASYYLGLKGGVDIEQVDVIRRLKETIGEKKA